ncbi:phosphoglycerate kinase [Candidatus Legionella polyplacis]|uniref:Phosphoglycerate kinase n=1 Tax=Candidatus Legionella polyplacis TaxID=2005262 RepID=A0ABZ2GX42_9GAMM
MIKKIIKINDINFFQKQVVIREDFNVPIKNNIIINDERLKAAIPTLKSILKKGASIIVLSHLGRPKEGKFDKNFSLKPIVKYFKKKLNYPISFVSNYLNKKICTKPKELIICENVRFNIGEKSNNKYLAKKLSNLGEIFIMDAFGVSHRIHASTYGIAKYARIAIAGPLFIKELTTLQNTFKNLKKPIITIIGGAKISNKLELLKKILTRTNYLILGGCLINIFIKTKIIQTKIFPYKKKLLKETKQIIELSKTNKCKIPFPIDVIVNKPFSNTHLAYNKYITNINNNDTIMDIGPNTINRYINYIHKAKTIIWNGPLGAFEFPQFSYGTKKIARTVANSSALSIIGGGDTISAINQYNLLKKIDYISTGGGAFIYYFTKRTLPIIPILEKKLKINTQ